MRSQILLSLWAPRIVKIYSKTTFDKIERFWTLCSFKILKMPTFSFFHTPPWWKLLKFIFWQKSGLEQLGKLIKKMKLICSNHIFEPILSNHVLQIDVDLIEKLIPCSWQGGPFEARFARLNFHKKYFLKHNSDAPSGARLAARNYIIIVSDDMNFLKQTFLIFCLL